MTEVKAGQIWRDIPIKVNSSPRTFRITKVYPALVYRAGSVLAKVIVGGESPCGPWQEVGCLFCAPLAGFDRMLLNYELLEEANEATGIPWGEFPAESAPAIRIGQLWEDRIGYAGSSKKRIVRVNDIAGYPARVHVEVTVAGYHPYSARWRNVGLRRSVLLTKFLQKYVLIQEAPLPSKPKTEFFSYEPALPLKYIEFFKWLAATGWNWKEYPAERLARLFETWEAGRNFKPEAKP